MVATIQIPRRSALYFPAQALESFYPFRGAPSDLFVSCLRTVVNPSVSAISSEG